MLNPKRHDLLNSKVMYNLGDVFKLSFMLSKEKEVSTLTFENMKIYFENAIKKYETKVEMEALVILFTGQNFNKVLSIFLLLYLYFIIRALLIKNCNPGNNHFSPIYDYFRIDYL